MQERPIIAHVPAKSAQVVYNVYLTPDIAIKARKRAQALRIYFSTYQSVLLSNAIYHHRPPIRSIRKQLPTGGQVRERVTISLDATIRADGSKFARERGGTLSRLLEYLVELDLEQDGPLMIWAS